MDNVNWDPRLVEVEEEKQAALEAADQEYEALITQTKDDYAERIAQEEAYGQAQTQAQQEKTDLEVEALQQKQADTARDYAREQSDAYTDYQTQVNPYGVVAENLAQEGLSGSGYSESMKTRLFGEYQNRLAAAREGLRQAMGEYDNALREAQRLNDAALAKIAYNALKRKSELSMKAVTKYNQLWQKWQDQRLDLEKYFRDWEEEVREEIQLNPWPGAAEPPRLPDCPDADAKRWAI